MKKLLRFKKLLLSLFLFSFSSFGFAQVKQEWVARYNGPANSEDDARSLALDKEGNVYVTGASTGIETGRDYTTIKYNAGCTAMGSQV